jgi:regulator of protease activity HflC (stomatin/prohibitin superfamily)
MPSSTSVSLIRCARIVNVEDYPFAVSQVAQTSLRLIIGKSDLDDLLTTGSGSTRDLS